MKMRNEKVFDILRNLENIKKYPGGIGFTYSDRMEEDGYEF
jgi:hypothetical protein